MKHQFPDPTTDPQWCATCRRYLHAHERNLPCTGQFPTLRDKFAMAALTGMLANATGRIDAEGSHEHLLACVAYIVADAMLKAREQP